MKKKSIISSLAGLALALGFASCSSEDFNVANGGDEAAVNVTVSLPGNMGSRAFADGLSADKLMYGVYEVTGATGSETFAKKIVDEKSFGNALSTNVPLRLISGKTYQVFFWAQSSTAATDLYTVTFGNDAASMAVDYSKMSMNDDNCDAYFGSTEIFTVTADCTIAATLTRPFAQINVGTDDYNAYCAAMGSTTNDVAVKTAISISSCYTKLNLMTGEASESSVSDLTFTAIDPAASTEAFPVGSAYKYMAMLYVLQGTGTTTPTANINITFTDGTNDINMIPVASAPIQRNYRTNIYGSLLTSSVNVTVTKDNEFETPANNIYISTASEFSAALNAGGDYVLVNDITLASNVVASTPVNIDLNDKKLNLGSNRFGVYSDVPVTITNGTINSDLNGLAYGVFDVGSDASPGEKGFLMLSNVTLNSPESAGISMHGKTTLVLENTTINAGSYCIATNASTPLVQTLDITINGGKYTGSSPIFVNVPCKLKMTNVEVNGSMHGVVARGGTVEINGGKIYMTYDETESDDDANFMASYFTSRNWGTGNTINLAALVMGNKVDDTSTSYRYATNVTLNGVEVACKGTHASKFPTVYIWANPAEGQGVTFNYDNTTTFTGGTGIQVGNNTNVTINGNPVTNTSN